MQMVSTTREQPTKTAAITILPHLNPCLALAIHRYKPHTVKGSLNNLPSFPSTYHVSFSNNLLTQTDKRRTLSPGRMPLTNFDAVSKSFNTNRHDLFPTSYIPSFSPPFYTSLSDELPYSTAPLQPQQQYKPQSSQQQNHSTQSYSEEESEILEKDLPPEPKLENTKLRRRRRAYFWYKNKIFPVDWKDLTSPILTSSYLLRLFCEPALESTQRLNL